MNKTELRIKYKALRANLSKLEIDDLSIAIANNVLKCDVWSHEYYHIFLPIETQKEVDTEFVLKILQNKNKKIDRKSTRLNSSHPSISRMPSSA